MADHPLRFMTRVAAASNMNVNVSWLFLSKLIFCIWIYHVSIQMNTANFRGLYVWHVNAGSCRGWSGSHYITFGGTPYTFSDNCSYILVQEIYNANLKIVLDKEVCSAESSFCPQSLIITYNSQDVILTQTMTSNGASNVVTLCL